MVDPVLLDRRLPPRAASAAAARRMVAEALEPTPYAAVADDARVAVSELVTNALVHAGTEIGLQVRIDDEGVLVEVRDGNPQTPAVRRHAREAGTGRGLHLVEGLADEWGVTEQDGGKAVWFRIGRPSPRGGRPETPAPQAQSGDSVQVELLDFPLLIHAAWQEHSATLLREYLLMSIAEDESVAFLRHARASEALHLISTQAPDVDLDEDLDRVLSEAVEPFVTTPRLTLLIPHDMLGAVDVLDEMMDEAVAAADEGTMLAPATQPEVREMRRWLCDQIRAQSLTGAAPEPYAADLHHEVVLDAPAPEGWQQQVAVSDRALVVSDDAGRIVAMSPPAVELLGRRPDELLGRRVLTLIPHRFRQAHVAGMTLHAINGRGTLLDRPVVVPVLLADGEEKQVSLVLRRAQADGERVFVAELGAA